MTGFIRATHMNDLRNSLICPSCRDTECIFVRSYRTTIRATKSFAELLIYHFKSCQVGFSCSLPSYETSINDYGSVYRYDAGAHLVIPVKMINIMICGQLGLAQFKRKQVTQLTRVITHSVYRHLTSKIAFWLDRMIYSEMYASPSEEIWLFNAARYTK
jgi:hypothetical protein